jgi:15-cis-phytoene synthase
MSICIDTCRAGPRRAVYLDIGLPEPKTSRRVCLKDLRVTNAATSARLSNAFDHAQDLLACQAMLRHGSKTFYAASFLLPRRIREPASALYAFCRLADDLVDLGHDAGAAIDNLSRRLDQAYDGHPFDHPADRAFARTVAEFNVPRTIPEALLEGFAWDAQGRIYETLDDVHAYGARVAGTVGAMMAVLMNRRSADDLARATDLGIAMQLTNIARDVGEDARAGRLYLPRQWLREAGIDPDAWLAAPAFSPAVAGLVARLLREADALYVRASAGIARLPADCRPGIYAARYLYAGIGHELMRQGYDSVTRRAVVPAGRKLSLVARALAATPMRRHEDSSAAVSEAAFLVTAAADDGPVPAPRDEMLERPWWDLHGKAVVLVEILDRLEHRERAAIARRHEALGQRRMAFDAEVST